MNYVKIAEPGTSSAEVAVLIILALLLLGAGWAFYRKWSGREKSDISGLHFGRRK
jgi:predicted transporter